MRRMKFIANMKRKEPKMDKKGVILLSSGLDSLVSLYLARKQCRVVLALTFDYGQKAAKDEIEAAKIITRRFNIEHKIIKLPYLEETVNNALTDSNKTLEFETLGIESMKAVWVPNRNGLFLNIAAMYADSCNIDYIIYGANKEEASTFSDNSLEFNEKADEFFKFSTLKHPVIMAPCADFEKFEIVQTGVNLNVDFSLLKSCYNSKSVSGHKHCGKCESCKRLYNAVVKSGNNDLLKIIF